ncbi:protein Mpv17 [Galleria mellonella]|uniref:Mitochondrial inner membrane protein Mpv17 n=1 Tax=Galleria mellonella TaxID=7137 RepID=A0A6J3C847_GALME|nr:protein Mpv17 [Galleria mellonella]XP_031769639.1 protein Mpv17 [Galleria mellonella]XP_031769640.1 protein Mpv17 [Galleria mellonella]
MQTTMRLQSIFKLYQKALVRRPYLVQAVQTGTLMGAGDIISQTIIEKKLIKELDYKRTLQFSSIGLFVGGPALRFWYGLLNHHIGSSGKSVTIKKVFIDQLVFAPAFLFLILSAVGTMQGKPWDIVKKDIHANYCDVLKTNYYIWPWVQIVNFYYVPLQYQVLLVQIVALFWNTYLSWKTNRKQLLE